jgi:O-antigen/teichoic acid export membrane protein
VSDPAEPAAAPGSPSGLVAATVATKAAAVVLAFSSSVVATRVLGAADRGRYAVLVTIALLTMSIGHLSVEHGQISLWPREQFRRALRNNAAPLGLGVGTAAAITGGLVVMLGGERVAPDAPLAQLAIAMAGVPIGVMALYLNSVLVLERRIRAVNNAALAAAAAQLTLVVGLAAGGALGVGGALVAWFTALAVPMIAALVLVRPTVRQGSTSVALHTLTTGIRYHPGMVSLVLLLQVDILMLSAMSTPAEVGIYALAVQLASLAFLLSDSVSQVALSDQTTATLESSAVLTAGLVRTNMLLLVMFLVPMSVLSVPLVPIVYGGDFQSTPTALAALAPGVLALGLARPVGAYLVRLGRPAMVSSIYTAALVLNVALNLVLIPRAGGVGAALASTVAYVVVGAASIGWMHRQSRVPMASFVAGRRDATALVALVGRLVHMGRARGSAGRK